MKKLINKLWKHTRDKAGDFGFRSLLHIPIGILMGIPIIGKPLQDIFIKYEDNEDFHTEDQAWKDYNGAMIGIVITELALIGFIAWLIGWLL